MRRHLAPEDKANLVLHFIKSKLPAAALCRKHRISQSNYYSWRKIFVLAGTDALRRTRKRASQIPVRMLTKANEDRAARNAEKMRLQRSIEAVLAPKIDRRARLTEATSGTIVDLIENGINFKVIGPCRGRCCARYVLPLAQNNVDECFAARAPVAQKYIKLEDRECLKDAVFKLLHSPPLDHGFNRTIWKVDDLQKGLVKAGLKLGKHAIRSIIKNAGYRWLKARKVLTSKDPDYRAKLDNIQRILGNLAVNEGFFSIDEYGPFAVKHRTGRRRVAPGEIATVPQWQKSKGFLIMTAALELSTNQVTHFYSEKKNTDEMIKLLEVLLERHENLSRIYLSWDAASWHISKCLSENILNPVSCL